MGFNVKKDEDEAQVNELVDVIDRLMMGGQGHLTIDIDETEEGLNVKTYSTSDCGGDSEVLSSSLTQYSEYIKSGTLLTEMKINSLF